MKQLHIYTLLAAIGGLLAGCQTATLDEPISETPTEARIEIMGGAPSGLPLSRASEPSQLGFCNADQLRIWVYQTSATILTVTPSSSELYSPDLYETDIINYCGNYNTDRWTSFNVEFDIPMSRKIGFAIPAIAFNKADEKYFSTNYNLSQSKYMEHTLSLSMLHTPELFFGTLKFNDVNEQSNGIFYVSNSGTAKTLTKGLEGKIYRLVSQLNLNIDEVNPDLVEKMELYLSNIPSSVILYGNHGAYYPVTPTNQVKTGADGEYLLIDTVEDFSKGSATLSTFLLPSTVGRKIKVKVYYSKEAYPKEAEKVIKEYDIKPAQSAYLRGDNAKVYGSDSPLYIYNSIEDFFFSYANVRVNLKGKFDNFFAETTQADVTLEVCPTFETSHNIPIIE